MPFSSPTTTSAVNEKRRPPLTTLATRLISTTRSCRSYAPGFTDRARAIGESPRVPTLEAQPSLTGAVGQSLDPAVVAVTAAIEHHGLDPGALRTLGQ